MYKYHIHLLETHN